MPGPSVHPGDCKCPESRPACLLVLPVAMVPMQRQPQQPCPGAVMLILGNTLLSAAFLHGLLYLIFSFSPVTVSPAPHSFLPLESDNSPAVALSFPFPNPPPWGYPSPASGTPLLEGPRGPSLLLIHVLPRHVLR